MIGEWLHNVRPPKYLRYLFFITYGFYRRFITHRGEAHRIAITFLGMIHVLAYQGIYYIFFSISNKLIALMAVSIVVIQFYFWLVYKGKWKLFIEEFKHINRKQQLFGGIYLFIYWLIHRNNVL